MAQWVGFRIGLMPPNLAYHGVGQDIIPFLSLEGGISSQSLSTTRGLLEFRPPTVLLFQSNP